MKGLCLLDSGLVKEPRPVEKAQSGARMILHQLIGLRRPYSHGILQARKGKSCSSRLIQAISLEL